MLLRVLPLLVLLAMTCCRENRRVEVLRLTSPESRVDAVIAQSNAGATAPVVFRIYVVRAGAKLPDERMDIFRADHAKDLDLSWVAPRLLRIRYSQARIYHFSNFWQSADVDNFHYVIEAKLDPTSNNYSLSERDRWLK